MDKPTPRSTRALALERRRALSHSGAAAVGAKPARNRRSRPTAESRPAAPAPQPAPKADSRPAWTLTPAGGEPVQEPDKGSESCGCDHGDKPAAPTLVISAPAGRLVAQERRAERCQVGRGDAPACRPSGRSRQDRAVAPKVEIGTTLRGSVVTGTHVDMTSKMTGPEGGACRVITGTEYTGSEQYAELCETTPMPSAAKVGMGSTSRGQRVTGTEIGRSNKVTGDEHGSCTTVTGNEYLSVEKVEAFCGTAPEAGPAKVSVLDTRDGQAVTGTAVGRSPKVTGDEAGACNKLTGSQYVSTSLPESLCGTRAPRKVSVMSTAKERSLTGTNVDQSSKVTGDDYGACIAVSGTEYVDLARYQACNRAPVVGPEKVSVMRTWRGQPVSGPSVERSENVTGDEYGSCQPVSGDEYVGPAQYAEYCEPGDQTASQARMEVRGPERSLTPSGTRVVFGGNVTGSERGEAVSVSGTPYSSGVQMGSRQLQGRFAQPGPRQAPPAPAPSEPWGGFSVSPPATAARDRSVMNVTGTAYSGGSRITGPVDRAEGLVSGTPEFRYREGVPAAAPPYVAQESPPEGVRSRLTGDGRGMGPAITGAAWRLNESVTGTEGASARRNPTLRGDARGGSQGALQNKGIVERVELPASKITGSSGNYPQGSLITYSGGARG